MRSTPIPLLAMRRTVKVELGPLAGEQDRAFKFLNALARSFADYMDAHDIARAKRGDIGINGASIAFNNSLILTFLTS